MTNQIPQANFFGILPAHIRYCKELEAQAKLLYVEITALCQWQGYCWATNAYFAEFFDVEERTIKRWLDSLESKGFIKRESENEGFKKRRKIWIIGEELKNFLRSDKNVTIDSVKNVTSEGVKNVPCNKISELDNNNPHKPPNPLKGGAPDGAGVDAFFISKDKSVKMTKAEYDGLVKAHGQEMTDAYIERLAEWKQENPALAKKRKSDYLAILRWVVLAVKEKQARERRLMEAENPKAKFIQPENKQTPPAPTEDGEKNRADFLEFRKENWSIVKERKIFLEDRVTFAQVGKEKIPYTAKDFFDSLLASWLKQLRSAE